MSTPASSNNLEGLCKLASMIDPTKDKPPAALTGVGNAPIVSGLAAPSAPSQPPSLESTSPPSPTTAGANAAMFQNMMMSNPYGMMFPFGGALPQQPALNVNGQAAAQASLQSSIFAQQMHYAAMMGYSAALQNPQIAQQHLALQKAATIGTTDLNHNPPGKKTGKWKEDEILTLRQGIDEYGRDWVKIAKMIPSRTREQVKNKGYAMILEDKTPNKATGHWKNVELEALKKGMEDWGPDWHRIAQVIPTRSWSQIVRKGKHMIDGSEVVLNSATPMLPLEPGQIQREVGDSKVQELGQAPGYAHLTPQLPATATVSDNPNDPKVRKNGHMANPTLDMPGGRLADSQRRLNEPKNKGGRPRKTNQERAREAAEREFAKITQQASTAAVLPAAMVNPMLVGVPGLGVPTLTPDPGTAAIMQAAALGPLGTGTGIPQPLMNPSVPSTLPPTTDLTALQQLQMQLPGSMPIAGLPPPSAALLTTALATAAANDDMTGLEPAAKRVRVEQQPVKKEEGSSIVQGSVTPTTDVLLPTA
ncbi:hypothetical protein TrST_g13913 [Triparma strigata]|uniref:Myb-like domain-containing protein n=1 Tax=Triparma strigata TaxID=1606541 RepID=A0A9W7BH75_9STRA|nr:hypothetical protein TrST_g13913 [Triparma strigata]